MLIEYLNGLPLQFIDTLVNILELIVICVPASAAFVYYRIKTISIWPIDITNQGAKILLHNRTNKSVFIIGIMLKPQPRCNLGEISTSYDKRTLCLKPDESKEIVINYTKQANDKQSFQFIVQYDHNKKKAIRVTV